jgi:hypothetical protein
MILGSCDGLFPYQPIHWVVHVVSSLKYEANLPPQERRRARIRRRIFVLFDYNNIPKSNHQSPTFSASCAHLKN